MKRLSIERINYGDHYVERCLCDKIKNLDGGVIEMSQNYLKIKSDIDSLESGIILYEYLSPPKLVGKDKKGSDK